MKECLVICPFGEENSESRRRSDEIFFDLLEPIMKEYKYSAYRSIDDPQPGDITSSIIKRIYEVDLVIADLTGSNPNVFYELALRHTVAKPFILISEDTSKIPFNIAQMDVISIGNVFTGGLTDIRKIQERIKKQIEKIEGGEVNFTTDACLQRPENFDKKNVKAYDWRLNYSRTLASDWLKLQDESVRNFMRDIVRDETAIPDDEDHREDLGEYIAYKLAQGLVYKGDLYYKVDQQTGLFAGWGILTMAEGKILPISVYGNDQPKGDILMKFDQPPQSIVIGKGIKIDIRGFKYSILFKLNPNEKVFKGSLIHPDFSGQEGGAKLIVGQTEIAPKLG